MPETLKESIGNIKKLEQNIIKNDEDIDSLKKLRVAFGKLQKIKDGPLTYLDVTGTEDMIHLYDVDAEQYLEEMQKEDRKLVGSSNPENYPWLKADIDLVVIDRTPANEKLAGQIVKEIISGLKDKLGELEEK